MSGLVGQIDARGLIESEALGLGGEGMNADRPGLLDEKYVAAAGNGVE